MSLELRARADGGNVVLEGLPRGYDRRALFTASDGALYLVGYQDRVGRGPALSALFELNQGFTDWVESYYHTDRGIAYELTGEIAKEGRRMLKEVSKSAKDMGRLGLAMCRLGYRVVNKLARIRDPRMKRSQDRFSRLRGRMAGRLNLTRELMWENNFDFFTGGLGETMARAEKARFQFDDSHWYTSGDHESFFVHFVLDGKRGKLSVPGMSNPEYRDLGARVEYDGKTTGLKEVPYRKIVSL
jgi:hypothetical protein